MEVIGRRCQTRLKEKGMKDMNVAVVGLGLIGGSLSLRMKELGLARRVIGVDANPLHREKAIEFGLVDATDELGEAVSASDLVMLATPVDAMLTLLPRILDSVGDRVAIDLGSTKSPIIEAVKGHPSRGRYVAAHPMWGTEYSGPQAAVRGAFNDKAVILCDLSDSDPDAAETARSLFRDIGMHPLEMTAEDHDTHAAYVSHISHITSFALANTVLEKEREDEAIFELASAGFESTVRLAKSNPDMWVPIFRQNRENVLDVLNEHISQLRKFKSCLEKENWDYLAELIRDANRIRRIIR
jgi:prephenate dehydrogenase